MCAGVAKFGSPQICPIEAKKYDALILSQYMIPNVPGGSWFIKVSLQLLT